MGEPFSAKNANPKPLVKRLRPQSAFDMWLGQRLRQLRKRQKISLATLAGECDLSVGLLSQIERGISTPSVKALNRLAQVLGVSTHELLENADGIESEVGGRVARSGTHRNLNLHDKGISKEIVSPPKAKYIDLCRATIVPGGSSGDQWFSTDKGEQVGMVLEGTLELWINDQVVVLQAGDSFCYSSRTPRRWRNPGDVNAEVIWAISNVHEPQEN